jgi:hypothetical protein
MTHFCRWTIYRGSGSPTERPSIRVSNPRRLKAIRGTASEQASNRAERSRGCQIIGDTCISVVTARPSKCYKQTHSSLGDFSRLYPRPICGRRDELNLRPNDLCRGGSRQLTGVADPRSKHGGVGPITANGSNDKTSVRYARTEHFDFLGYAGIWVRPRPTSAQ